MRVRRIRDNPLMRRMMEETSLSPRDFIYPPLLVERENIRKKTPSLSEVCHFPLDQLDQEIKEIEDLGTSGVILFGILNHKNAHGSQAYAEDDIIQRGAWKVKSLHPNLLVVTNVCMHEYTDHSHCGVLDEDDQVINGTTIRYITKITLSHTQARASIATPSDTMDSRVWEICQFLNMNGYEDTPIVTYGAKFASNYYDPFRQAADSTPSFRDRKSYQMNFHNGQEAPGEVTSDLDGDADFITVKSVLVYLDVIKEAREGFNTVLVVYNVSGKYSMLKSAIVQSPADKSIIYESIVAIKRAGVQTIISYHAREATKKLKKADL